MSFGHAVKRWIHDMLGRAIIVALGCLPVTCHYQITGPVLWQHQSSYAFEAWLVMWIGGILLSALSIYIATRPNEPDA